jgi:hypothetical protein
VNDQEILNRINQLVQEEHDLLSQEEQGEITDPGNERMRALEVTLDQCWDLLRQRRARRDFGDDPDKASVRSAEVVEHYKQ